MNPVNDRLSILLVEDDDIDILAIKRAFAQLEFDWPVHVAHDGIEALRILRGEGGKPALSRPYLILLDLNMPRMHGLEFLAELRADAELKKSIVFVLTTSAAEADVEATYTFHVAGFISKRGAEDTTSQLARLVEIYARSVHFPH